MTNRVRKLGTPGCTIKTRLTCVGSKDRAQVSMHYELDRVLHMIERHD